VALSDKYVVIKADRWGELLMSLDLAGQGALAETAAAQAPIDGDYFVIRDQDVFAAQGLFAYASNIRTAVEFTQTVGLSVMTDEVRDRLLDLANELVDTACSWMEADVSVKVPD
jgi:hypothetical protein